MLFLNFKNIEIKIIEFLFCLVLCLIFLLKLKIINIAELKQLILTVRKNTPDDSILLNPQNK